MASHFTSLETATPDDWARIMHPSNAARARSLAADGLIGLIRAQEHLPLLDWPISTYTHALQAATRAFQAGEAEETVVCALLHDAFDTIDLHDHGASIATLLGPYVSEEACWMLARHAVFQDYHAQPGTVRHSMDREVFRGHPAFEKTALFCERYDQLSFDPAFPCMPLEAFVPMVHRLLMAAPS